MGRNSLQSKRHNRGLVIGQLLTGVCGSRIELARRTGLSKMTVTNIVADFIAQGMVEECEEQLTETCGRNPIRLRIGSGAPRVAGLLVQREGIVAALCTLELEVLKTEEVSFLSVSKDQLPVYACEVLDRLLAGESCALVTDAGTPAISDPGEELVARCAELGVPVCAIPGPCALVTALAVSGQPTGRFTFEGFLAMNKKNRRAHLDALREEERTMVFYEAPHKLAATLEDLSAAFGPDRPLTLCRELTKLHEEVRRTTLGQAAACFRENDPRGEFVLVVRGAEPVREREASLEDGLVLVDKLRGEGLSLRDAVRRAARELGLSRNQLYDLAVGK